MKQLTKNVTPTILLVPSLLIAISISGMIHTWQYLDLTNTILTNNLTPIKTGIVLSFLLAYISLAIMHSALFWYRGGTEEGTRHLIQNFITVMPLFLILGSLGGITGFFTLNQTHMTSFGVITGTATGLIIAYIYAVMELHKT